MLKRALGVVMLAMTAATSASAQDVTAKDQATAPAAAAAAPAATEPAAAPTAPAAPAAATAPATATPAAPTAAVANDPAPEASAPDPLTPKVVDQGPALAPGVPARAADAAPAQPAAADPVVLAIRTRLESWNEAHDAASRGDLAAIKAFYGEATSALWTASGRMTAKADQAVAAFKRADTQGLDPAAFELPALPQPGALADTLVESEIRISQAALKYARHARGGRLDPPSLSKMIDMRPRLFEPRSVLDALAAAPAVDSYLEGLNPHHAGFAALRTALAKARAEQPAEPQGKPGHGGALAGSETVRRILVNMEKWRWLPTDLGNFYVWDNVPEQYTRVYHDGQVVLKERIVVGKPNTPTPIFSARMQFVIFHPSWGVPEGIKSNELGPMLRRAQANSSGGWFFSENDGASRALRRYELRAYVNGREVNPDSVNWSSIDVRNVHFTQGPSARNVLGIVKFRFPNKFDVYMHDTPERHLFNQSSRVFSHGCMRVQNPMHLAETILAYDKGWSKEKVAGMAARGSTTDVTLEKNVPVHIVYFTSTVDENGKLVSHPDVYGVDGRIASALAGRSVVLASAKGEPEPQAAARPGRREATGQKQKTARRQVKTKQAGGGAWDPFGFLSAN